MSCAPRQMLSLCMAALAVNAVAFELKLFPNESMENAFYGNSSALLDSIEFSFVTGDHAAVEKKLAVLKKRYPQINRSLYYAGVELAKGKQGEALNILKRIAADNNDPQRFEAAFAVAKYLFEKENFVSALPFFQLIDTSAAPEYLRFQGRSGMILCLLKSRVFYPAGTLIEKAERDFPGQQQYWEKLKVAVLGNSGEYLQLEKLWSDIRKRHLPDSCEFIFDGLTAGAAAARDKNELKTAEFLFAESFNFAADNKARRNVLKNLIATQEKSFPERALKTITRYFRYFPGDSAVGEIKLIQGAIFNRLKRYADAKTLLVKLINDNSVNGKVRANAAVSAAFSAEKLGETGLARELYNSAIRRLGDDIIAANQVKMQLLEFFLRIREFSPAVILGEELSGSEKVDQEKLNLYRLQALMAVKHYDGAAVIAEKLSKSANRRSAAEGAWHFAHIRELQGDLAGARKLYLDFCRRFSGDHRISGAMLTAADFAMRQRDFQDAVKEFMAFIEKFPDHRGVRSAILGALYSTLHCKDSDNTEQAAALLERLEKEFSGSSEFEHGVMEMASFHFRKGNYDGALELLEKFLRMRPDSGKVPEALILEVKLFEKIGNYTSAIEYADRILDKYPNTPFAVEAAMLGGSCCFQSGKYQQALKYYERAGELGGGSIVSQVAAGEAADCHLLLRKPENLAEARKIYQKLASETEFPALQIQALYKLGLAFEYSSMNMQALENYEKLLYIAASSEKVRRSSGVANWCVRAARSALRIILGAADMPDGSQRAQRVYQMYSHLELPGSADELRSYLMEIQKHYNLLD